MCAVLLPSRSTPQQSAPEYVMQHTSLFSQPFRQQRYTRQHFLLNTSLRRTLVDVCESHSNKQHTLESMEGSSSMRFRYFESEILMLCRKNLDS